MGDLASEATFRHAESQAKHSYFLIALAGACVAFAIERTSDSQLDAMLLPIGVAVLSWAMSVVAGISNRMNAMGVLADNIVLLKGQQIVGMGGGTDKMKEQIDSLRAAMERRSDRASLQFSFQVWSFYAGAVAFIAWHVCRIVANSPGVAT